MNKYFCFILALSATYLYIRKTIGVDCQFNIDSQSLTLDVLQIKMKIETNKKEKLLDKGRKEIKKNSLRKLRKTLKRKKERKKVKKNSWRMKERKKE